MRKITKRGKGGLTPKEREARRTTTWTEDKLREAHGRVLDRMGCYPETLEQAAEAVAPDYGDVETLISYARGGRA